jgi:hypothetical protein
MCGGESRVSIERMDNGFVVDSYHPGEDGEPGRHKRSVATKPEHVLKIVHGHLTEKPKMRGKKGRKKAAYKRED